MSAFAPLCTRRERSQIGTGNRVRTGELPIRVDQFLAIRAEKLCEALAYFGEDIGAMMALVDRALAINPNFARGWHVSGVLRKGPMLFRRRGCEKVAPAGQFETDGGDPLTCPP